MKPQFQHKVATSYLLWFENYFFKKSEAYSVETGSFTPYTDTSLPSGYQAFGLPHKQLIYDNSMSGAYIPSGVYIDNVFTPIETGKYMIDFENGRFIGSGVGTGAAITGSFSPKELNVYYTNETEENVVINIQDKIDESVKSFISGYYDPNIQKLPAIYVSNYSMENAGFALGGMVETTTQAKAIVIANNAYELDCVLSVFADSYNEVIPLVEFDSYPLDEYGGIKSGSFSYETLKSTYPKEIFVKSAITSKMSDRVRANNILKNLYVGFVDFDLSTYRYRE